MLKIIALFCHNNVDINYIKLKDNQLDFIGYEGNVTKLLGHLHLISNLYAIEFQCWSCSCISARRIDLASIYTFMNGSQNSVDTQTYAGYQCLKCRDPGANIERISQEFIRIPAIFILEVGHLHMKRYTQIKSMTFYT